MPRWIRLTPGAPAGARGCSPARSWSTPTSTTTPGCRTAAATRPITDHARWASVLFGLTDAPGAIGIDAHAWARTRELADQADDPGGFVALAGFEWSHALHGHMSVWGSQRYTDALRTFGPRMAAFWRWLEGPGEDGLAGFNHPPMSTAATGATRTARGGPGSGSTS